MNFNPKQLDALRKLDCPWSGHPLDITPTYYECSGNNCTFVITKREYDLVVTSKL